MKRTAIVLSLLIACGSKDLTGSSSATASSTSTATQVKSGVTATTSLTTSAKPPPGPTAPAEPIKRTRPIRENVSKGAEQGGAALEARMFVSKFTTADPVRLALRFRVDKPPIDEAVWQDATIPLSDFIRSFRFEVTSPGGVKTVLEPGDGLGTESLGVGWMTLDLTITEEGIKRYDKTATWTKPAPGLFSKPGKYSIAIKGNPTFGKPVSLMLAPLAFEVVDPSAGWKSIADLTNDAASLVKDRRSLSKAPTSFTLVIDDDADNRWFRFRIDTEGPSNHSRYDVDIVEVLLDPSGKEQNFDSFPHFTCVAEGVPITTPTGRVPIETLEVGDEVIAWDPVLRTKTIATVQHVTASHSEHLLAFGELRVTAAHPVFADDTFQAAATIRPTARLLGEDLQFRSALPIELEHAATVYDLDVSPPNTYFAGGVLVHNKAVAEVVGGRAQPFQGWFYRRAVER